MRKTYFLLGAFLGVGLTFTGVLAASHFSDIPENHWAKQAVDNLVALGVLKGYPDGTFKGDDKISRYEAAAMLNNNNQVWANKMQSLQAQIDGLSHMIDEGEGDIVTLKNILSAGNSLSEIAKPNLDLPSGIHENQIKHYFKLGDFYLAPVLTRSMNVYLAPENVQMPFAGILIADQNDTGWSKLLSIKDKDENGSTGNNPYYLWTDAKKLMVSIVDQNGAGSGEGVEKVYSTVDGQSWNLTGCYSFSGEENPNFATEAEGDGYFAYSKELADFKVLEMTMCQDDAVLTVQ